MGGAGARHTLGDNAVRRARREGVGQLSNPAGTLAEPAIWKHSKTT